jgi:hypothetical protein
LLGTFNLGGNFVETASQLHFEGTTTGGELGVNDDIAGNTESILEVALNFVEDILRCTTEDNRASVGLLALGKEREIVVTDFVDLEKCAVLSNIRLLDFFRAVDNGGTSGTSNTVVISFTETAENRAVSVLEKLVESEIAHTLLSDDDIGFDLKDGSAHTLNFNLLHSEGLFEIIILSELHVGHRLSLLVLKGAIEKHNAGVADLAAHTRVADVLVEHDTVEDLAVFEETSRDFLNLSVALGIDFDVIAILNVDSTDSLDSEVYDEVSPLGGELGADGALNNFGQVFVVLHVDFLANELAHLNNFVEATEVGIHNNSWVNVTLEEALNSAEDLTGEDNNRGGTITDFLILSTGKLNHRFGSGVVNVNLKARSNSGKILLHGGWHFHRW